jgi:hypothetical protein
VAVLLLIIVGVILGVAVPLTTNNNNNNNNKDSPSIDSTVTPTQSRSPTQSPTQSPSQSQSPTKAPTATPTATPTQTPAPTACTSLECLAEILLQIEVSDAEALQDDLSPQFLALRWLANDDTAVLDLDKTPSVILVERYVLAVFYFATSTEGELDGLNFLSASSVCEWNNRQIQGVFLRGVYCNEDVMVIGLDLGKSKHEEVIVLISKFWIHSPVYLPFYLNRESSTQGFHSERTRRTDVVDVVESPYVH